MPRLKEEKQKKNEKSLPLDVNKWINRVLDSFLSQVRVVAEKSVIKNVEIL